MRHKRKPMTALPILILLLCSVAISLTAFAFKPGPMGPNTSLEVRQPGNQTLWGPSRTIHALHAVTFRWGTSVPNTNFGQWQLCDYKPAPQDLMAQPFAVGDPGMVPQAGGFTQFIVDFAQLQQQHPDKIPAQAPATAKDYYLRLVPWKTMAMTDPANVSGDISINIKITYVKSSAPPPIPPAIEHSTVSFKGGHFVILSYSANKPVIPIVMVSTFAPELNSKGYETFGTHKIDSASIPFLSGYEKNGEVILKGLRPKTHYYYIIEANDEKKLGPPTFATGEFTTATPQLSVSFDSVRMIDDSDELSDGDIQLGFFANGKLVKVIPDGVATMSFGSGTTLPIFNVGTVVIDPPNSVEIRVNGFDEDCPLIGVCDDPVPTSNPKLGNGSNGAGEWAVAATQLDVKSLIRFEPPEMATTKFIIGANGALKFNVHCTATLTYPQ